MAVTSTDLAVHQKKFISSELIARSEQLHRLPQFGDKRPLKAGSGSTAYFYSYARTNIPTENLSEGVTPTETTFTVSQTSVTVEEWGLFIALTDAGIVKTDHPLVQEALDLIADAVARTQDYTIADVLMAGTNVQYWDGTRANRAAVTATDVFKKEVLGRSGATMKNDGAPRRSGDFYVAVLDPYVHTDILTEAAANGGGFMSASALGGQGMKNLERGTAGAWLGHQFVESNFLPIMQRISGIAPVASTTTGSLTGTIHYKITRRDLLRGFEEGIAVASSTAMAADDTLTFTAPSTAGYIYNIYAGSSAGDANLYLAKENLAASGVYALLEVPTSGANPPETPAASVNVHVMFVFGGKAMDTVDLNDLNMMGSITPAGASDSDPLAQRRKMGSKWSTKSAIRKATNFRRIELASNYN
jgi:N4-gp56 family major capsid protein